MNDYESDTFLNWREEIIVVIALLSFLAVPILTLLVLTISTLVRRTPVASGLVRSVRIAVVPIACVLLLIYCGLVVWTSRQEKVVGQGLEQMQQNQSLYFADLTGQAWPGAVK